jgi:hypothetical protein
MTTTNPADRAAHDDEEDAALWAAFLASQAPFGLADAARADANLHGADARRTVRAALAIMTKSGAELAGSAEGDAGGDWGAAMRNLADCAGAHARTLRCAAEVLESAALRLHLALCAAPDEGRGVRP